MSTSSGRTSRASFVSSGLPVEAILAGRASVDLKARTTAAAAAQPVVPVPVAPSAPVPRPRSFTAAHAAEFERAYRHSQIGTSTPAMPRTYTPTSELVRAGSVRGTRSSTDGRPPSSLDLLSTHHLPAAHYDVALSNIEAAQPRQLGMTGSAPYARPAPLNEKLARPSIDHDALERLIQQADDYESSHSVLGMRLGTNDLVRAVRRVCPSSPPDAAVLPMRWALARALLRRRPGRGRCEAGRLARRDGTHARWCAHALVRLS